MRQTQGRERSTAEIAFLIMRVLAVGRVLWAERGGLPLPELTGLLDAPAAQIACALRSLHEEGIVRVIDGVVELTERGAHDLTGSPTGGAGDDRLDRRAPAPILASEIATSTSGPV